MSIRQLLFAIKVPRTLFSIVLPLLICMTDAPTDRHAVRLSDTQVTNCNCHPMCCHKRRLSLVLTIGLLSVYIWLTKFKKKTKKPSVCCLLGSSFGSAWLSKLFFQLCFVTLWSILPFKTCWSITSILCQLSHVPMRRGSPKAACSKWKI
jgi:hypothetical protein